MSLDKAILLTRPEGSNEEFARAIHDLDPNLPVISMPLSRRVATNVSIPDMGKYDAIIVTSRAALDMADAGLRAKIQNMPAFVVGERSYQKLQEWGAKPYPPADSALALNEVILQSKIKDLLYLRGEDVKFSFRGALEKAGRNVNEIVIYRMEPILFQSSDFEQFSRFYSLLLPVFSFKSFLQLEKIIPYFVGKKTWVLPISQNLADSINQRGYKATNLEILSPPKRPRREEMLEAVENQFKLL